MAEDFLAHSPTYAASVQRRVRERRQCVVEFLDVDYCIPRGEMQHILTAVRDLGYHDCTESTLRNDAAVYRTALRFLTTDGPDEYDTLVRRTDAGHPATVGIRCLVEDGIFEWEQLVALRSVESAPAPAETEHALAAVEAVPEPPPAPQPVVEPPPAPAEPEPEPEAAPAIAAPEEHEAPAHIEQESNAPADADAQQPEEEPEPAVTEDAQSDALQTEQIELPVAESTPTPTIEVTAVPASPVASADTADPLPHIGAYHGSPVDIVYERRFRKAIAERLNGSHHQILWMVRHIARGETTIPWTLTRPVPQTPVARRRYPEDALQSRANKLRIIWRYSTEDRAIHFLDIIPRSDQVYTDER
ncbi:MAG: hypothetical protein Q7T01_01075 [bacterium]|nr:hypothetical protein [bacterium]